MFDDVCLVCGRIADGLYCSEDCKDNDSMQSTALDIDLGFITDSLPPLLANKLDHSTVSSPTSSILTTPSAPDDDEDEFVLPFAVADADALIPPTLKQSRSNSHSQSRSARSPLLKPIPNTTNLNFIRKPGPTNVQPRGVPASANGATASIVGHPHGHSHSHSHHLQLPQTQHKTLHKRTSSHSHSSTSSTTATTGVLFDSPSNSIGHHHSRPQISGRTSHPHSSSSRVHSHRQGHASSSSSSSAHCSPDLQASSDASRHHHRHSKDAEEKAKKKRSRASLPAYFSSILINPSTPVTAITMDTTSLMDDESDAKLIPKSIASNSFSVSGTIRYHPSPRPDSKRHVSDHTSDISAALASLTSSLSMSVSTKKVQNCSFSPTTPTVRRVVQPIIHDEVLKSGISRGRDRTERGRQSDGTREESVDAKFCSGCFERHKDECPRRIRFKDAVVPEHPLSDDEEDNLDMISSKWDIRPEPRMSIPSPPPSFRGRGGVDMAAGGGRTVIMKLRRFSSPSTTSPSGRGIVASTAKPRLMFVSPVLPQTVGRRGGGAREGEIEEEERGRSKSRIRSRSRARSRSRTRSRRISFGGGVVS